MTRFIVFLTVALLLAPVLSLVLGTGSNDGLVSSSARSVRPPAELMRAPNSRPGPHTDSSAAPPPAPAPTFAQPGEDALFDTAARTAWQYVESQSNSSTGLVNSVIGYPYATVWDIASGLAAIYCAYELGLVDRAEYDRRMGRSLKTLQALRLFDGVAYNKNYQIATGQPAGRHNRERPPRPDGYGWSAIDTGRLLVWLRIIARSDPGHAAAATAAASRIDFQRLIASGYLQGEALDSRGRPRAYQEGRIGYEQYAAAGFALWEKSAPRALNWDATVRRVEVYGVPLLADRREGAYLTSEPFVLLGLELGWWDADWKEQAEAVLAAQVARHETTGQLTIVSEDALPVAPDYFYYYTVFDDGEPFAIRSLGPRLPDPEPRWVSTKAAFGWYALFPGPYTWQGVQEVAAKAQDPRLGWSSGFYERSGKPTGSQNINTSAVVLEAALYRKRRQPLAMSPPRIRADTVSERMPAGADTSKQTDRSRR